MLPRAEASPACWCCSACTKRRQRAHHAAGADPADPSPRRARRATGRRGVGARCMQPPSLGLACTLPLCSGAQSEVQEASGPHPASSEQPEYSAREAPHTGQTASCRPHFWQRRATRSRSLGGACWCATLGMRRDAASGRRCCSRHGALSILREPRPASEATIESSRSSSRPLWPKTAYRDELGCAIGGVLLPPSLAIGSDAQLSLYTVCPGRRTSQLLGPDGKACHS